MERLVLEHELYDRQDSAKEKKGIQGGFSVCDVTGSVWIPVPPTNMVLTINQGKSLGKEACMQVRKPTACGNVYGNSKVCKHRVSCFVTIN